MHLFFLFVFRKLYADFFCTNFFANRIHELFDTLLAFVSFVAASDRNKSLFLFLLAWLLPVLLLADWAPRY